jgi:2',3'-cyclic-nucleotide 2'-phosphodiesterase/3'-nucleotidase
LEVTPVRRSRPILLLAVVALTASLGAAPVAAAPAVPVTFTILHTNDFHGQLEPSGSNPGYARVATVVNDVRTAVGADNVLLADVGDEMQGSLLSNLYKGQPVIDAFSTLGVDVATFGNHEFDWGQDVLVDRVAEASYPYVSANIVVNDTGNCATAGWTSPSFAEPWVVQTVGSPTSVKVGFVGVTTAETPTITIASATEGLCFKDPAASIAHYYDAMKAAGADVVVVLSHLGLNDGGYGYGIPVYGDKTLAQKLIDAGKPANLILGGHSHTNMTPPATVVGPTTVAHAYYNGRTVGRADVTVATTGAVSVNWSRTTGFTGGAEDPVIKDLIAAYASDPDYQALINQPVGYVQTDLLRNYNGDSMMGDFVDDAIYGALNTDVEATNDVDMFFNNAGGIRIDWCDKEEPAGSGTWIWSSLAADCQAEGLWSHDPMLLNYGQMFQILPFGNATAVGTMTGAQIHDLLQQSATLFKGALQPSGVRYKFFRYSDALPGPQPYGWGAYDIEVFDKDSGAWEPLDAAKTYKVGTNEFLAPAGQDGFTPFKYLKDITYWGDMLDSVNAYVSASYTLADPYRGPDGDGTLDGRITRNGNGDDTYEAGEVVPLTVLHHNDSHGNLLKGTFVGYTQLVTLINQARAHNPGRTLLLSSGDNIQGDSMMYYFKSAGLGYTSDGTPLAAELQINPLIKAFNAVGYDAYTLGNHEFNFGKEIFGTLTQADFPVLQANIADTGEYGITAIPVEPYVEKTVGPEEIKVAILGIGNHRVPNYELPSNIPGLTFSDPIAAGAALAPDLADDNDVVIALTHIGFTTNPASVEVDNNVDTYFATQVPDVDAIIGGHSHTNPATGFGDYKYLPAFVANPDNEPVIVTQANRYNNTLGTVSLGLLPDGSGGYQVVSSAGRYESVAMATAEDAAIATLLQPYKNLIDAYNATVIGQTTVPIDALQAFTQETNGANLQADAAVYELETKNAIPVDFHLSGAMTNRKVADAATPAVPVSLKVSDMFSLMPYENSLVVMEMNGPQLKAVLERAYRNYYYYKYVPGYGGYSYYTTCMLDINAGGQITYNDLAPAAYDATKQYVVSLEFDGKEVDFADADTYYRVSTVNYLAAGSCNFNDSGVSLWPLDRIVNDTQFYVRDAVIDYVTYKGTVSPAIEGRLQFITDTAAPVITIVSPEAKAYLHPAMLTLDFAATDDISGVRSIAADLDGVPVTDGQVIDLLTLALGNHSLTVHATDMAWNESTASVTFSVKATIASLKTTVNRFYAEGQIKNAGLRDSLISKLNTAQTYLNAGNKKAAKNALNAFISAVRAQSGKGITTGAATILITDARYVIAHL